MGKTGITNRFVCLFFVAVFCLLWAVAPASAAEIGSRSEGQTLNKILRYISDGWETLTRSMSKCETVRDSNEAEEALLYLPRELPLPAAVQELEQNCPVRVERLPALIEKPAGIDIRKIRPHGLLYLENSYVVPGGMFNEMYGWDSYFILRGLLRDGRFELARGMVENFFFEIEHYGMILNANRAHFLTRSQPPFLTSMILAVHEAEKERGQQDLTWLANAYRYALKDYQMWTREPHLAGTTGLSRYYGLGEGVNPELSDRAREYFSYVVRYFLRHKRAGDAYLARASNRSSENLLGPALSLYLCNSAAKPDEPDDCELVENVSLTADYYKGDRSMRESGFDISFRFGPFSAATHHYAPVCLNSLLYKAAKDLEEISLLLGREEDARQWHQRARTRMQQIQTYLWDEQRGLFFDYDFKTQTRSSYEFATTFYPLWVGLASPEQAQAIVRNLPLFEQPGGLAMSTQETKTQWDYPYGWAPVHLIAIEGLRRYSYEGEANRLSYKFLSMILENFRRDGTLREKYNVVTRSSETQIEAGYKENVIGFGWTNGVFLELLDALPEERAIRLAEE
ncbi:MAG: trehalase family glycosidase [Terriglobia bacterium]